MRYGNYSLPAFYPQPACYQNTGERLRDATAMLLDVLDREVLVAEFHPLVKNTDDMEFNSGRQAKGM